MEDDAAHQLDVEERMPIVPLERLAHGGVRLEEDLLERLAVLDPLLELGGLAAQLVVRERLELGSSEPMYAACWARRLIRRPSPTRRTFSKEPRFWATD